MNTAAVSLVISTYQEGHALLATLESVLAADVVPAEIIVVDDGSTDGSCDGLPTHVAGMVRLLRQPHAGIAPARNRGADEATQPVVAFLDAHCAVEPGWLPPLAQALASAPEAVAGGAVRDERDPRFTGVGARIVNPLLEYRWLPPIVGCEVTEVGVVPGGCLAVGRDTFRRLGGFGPFREFGFEDVDFSVRAWRAGCPLLGVSAARVTHRFRRQPPYPPDHLAWLQNLCRTALVHLEGEDLRLSLAAAARFSRFNSALTDALCDPALVAARNAAGALPRLSGEYLRAWATSAFPGPRGGGP